MKKILILGSSGYIGSYLSYVFKKKYNVITHSRKKIKDTFEVQFDAQKLDYQNLRCLVRYVETNHQYPRIRLADNFLISDIVKQIDFIKT